MVLVNVEDLKKELDALMKRRGVTSWMQTAFDAQDILWVIEGTPEVDATRHGQWIEHGPDWLCSYCGTEFRDELEFIKLDYDYYMPHYCPHCGARMDLEENDES